MFQGKSVGEIKPLNGIPTYITRPESKDTTYGVLILPDVIGHEFVNVQLVADQLAANGYLTVVPDLFEGDPVPLNRPDDFNLQGWLKGHQPDKVDPIVEKAIDGMKKDLGVKHIAAIGYCFGARYVARFAAKGKGIDVGYMAHPSFVSAEELKGVAAPLSIAAAGTSSAHPFGPSVCPLTISSQRRTKSSRPRSATRVRTSSREWTSLTRSACTAASSTASPSAAT